MMSRHWPGVLLVPLIATLGGCIVMDQLTTLTINPNGSADITIFSSNIRSTQKGEEGKSEIADYRASFDARSQDDLRHLRESGARLEQASWLRDEVPLANVVYATFPDVESLKKYTTMKDDDGSILVQSRFVISNTSRRLSFQVTIKADQIPRETIAGDDLKRKKLERASGISETRFAVRNGEITGATGFVISEDRQSALLDLDAILSLLRAGNGSAEVFLDWQVQE